MPNCHTSAKYCYGILRAAFAGLSVVLLAICLVFVPVPKGFTSQEAAISAVLLSLETDGETVSLNFDEKVDLNIVHFDSPPRIIIDLPETNFASLNNGARLPELISGIRFGLMAPGQSRIVLSLAIPAIATNASPEIATNTHKISFTIVEPAEFQSRAAADAAKINPANSAKSDGVASSPSEGGPFTVVIDPGHGGIDGGAEGKLGTREKDITLAFGLAIRDALKNTSGVKVVMTRETDAFVGLNERVKIARQNSAELFLSIHGDSIKLPDVRGATLYTLSDSASDAISNALANQENLSDTIAGLPQMQPDEDMNSILVDLLKQETATFSRELASQIVVHLQENDVELINNPIRAAGFSVLTAPDVPSLLLEMGYLSNHEDELLMRDPEWRLRTANVIATAIEKYAAGHRTRNAVP